METVKSIFFFIGSIAGILAFIKTVYEPSLTKNRDKWKKIIETVSDSDFRLVESGTLGYKVPGLNLQRVECLIYDYSQKVYYTQFNGLHKNLYKEYFEELVIAHSNYRALVQVNEWLPTEGGDWRFNKEAFAKEDGIPRNYSEHVYAAEAAAEEMKHAFKKLEMLSDLELWQWPRARKIVELAVNDKKN